MRQSSRHLCKNMSVIKWHNLKMLQLDQLLLLQALGYSVLQFSFSSVSKILKFEKNRKKEIKL